mmetsp:Transcript_14340/g.19633  ORF Transcript_14340/g.19633 Transcript_14340/m.19633 type:complete len:165 (+) Transcript_14340:113-607(+)
MRSWRKNCGWKLHSSVVGGSSSTLFKVRPLTSSILSRAKENLLTDKSKFASDGGLYAQLALLHSKFITSTVDDLLKESISSKIHSTSSYYELLSTDRQFCVRHHFGELRAHNTQSYSRDAIGPILSMFWTFVMILDSGLRILIVLKTSIRMSGLRRPTKIHFCT